MGDTVFDQLEDIQLVDEIDANMCYNNSMLIHRDIYIYGHISVKLIKYIYTIYNPIPIKIGNITACALLFRFGVTLPHCELRTSAELYNTYTIKLSNLHIDVHVICSPPAATACIYAHAIKFDGNKLACRGEFRFPCTIGPLIAAEDIELTYAASANARRIYEEFARRNEFAKYKQLALGLNIKKNNIFFITAIGVAIIDHANTDNMIHVDRMICRYFRQEQCAINSLSADELDELIGNIPPDAMHSCMCELNDSLMMLSEAELRCDAADIV